MCMQSLNPFMPVQQKVATPAPRGPVGPALNPKAPLPMQVGADEEAAIAARNAQIEAERAALDGAQGPIDPGGIGREMSQGDFAAQRAAKKQEALGFNDAIGASLGVAPKAPVPTQTFGAGARGQKAGARLGAAAGDSFTSKKATQSPGRIVE